MYRQQVTMRRDVTETGVFEVRPRLCWEPLRPQTEHPLTFPLRLRSEVTAVYFPSTTQHDPPAVPSPVVLRRRRSPFQDRKEQKKKSPPHVSAVDQSFPSLKGLQVAGVGGEPGRPLALRLT